MNDAEVYNNLCNKCRRESKRSKLVDSYCKPCSDVLFKLNKIEQRGNENYGN